MCEIILPWPEVVLASNVGTMRNIQSMKAGRKPRQGLGIDMWVANIEGAMGEMVVAKHLDLFWAGAMGDVEAMDVGPYQVKTNTSRQWDDLIIRTWNDPSKIYIGVLSFVPRFIITGWIHGSEGMTEANLREGKKGMPAYFVPRATLNDLKDLPPV